ncbi:MAG: hypothetical protein IH987_11285 [Planctomycetes bacterium]|nr:hypothetical protein [Planctomycetota bacterium]
MTDKDGLLLAATQGIRKNIDEFCRDLRLAKKIEANLPKPADNGDSDQE